MNIDSYCILNELQAAAYEDDDLIYNNTDQDFNNFQESWNAASLITRQGSRYFAKLSIQCSQASTRWSQETKLISKLAAKTKQEIETKKLFVESRKKQQHFWSKKKSNTRQDLKQNAKFRHTYKLRPKCASKSALMMSFHRTTNGSFSNFLKLSCAKVQRT